MSDLARRVAARYAAEMSIGALERAVRRLANELEKLGMKTDIDVFKTGRGGTQFYGPSYVELAVTAPYKDRDGEEDEAYAEAKFLAGGYAATGNGEFGGEPWRTMARDGREYLMKSLARQGWTVENAIK